MTTTSLSSALTLLAPREIITDGYGNPTYTWSHTGADSYEFYLDNSANDGQPIYYGVGLAEDVYCTGMTCSFDPTLLAEIARLRDGDYVVYLRGTTSGVAGSVQGPFTFTLNAAPPAPVIFGTTTGTDTLRPTFNWSASDEAAYATWFRLFLIKKGLFDAAIYTPTADVWFSRAQLCGGVDSLQCTVQTGLDLQDETAYYLYIQSYGPGGLSVGGAQYNNGWAGAEVTVNILPNPNVPVVNVAPNQGRPTISWANDTNATQYYAYLRNQANNATQYLEWHASTSLCSGEACTITPESLILANGTYEAYIYACGAGGCSIGGVYNNGWGGGNQGGSSATFSYAYNPPQLVPIDSMTFTYADGAAEISWTGVEHATWYYVYIGTYGGAYTAYLQWISSSVLGCPAMGTCSASTGVNLPPGDHYLAVKSAGPGGFSLAGLINNGFQVLELPLTIP